MITSDPDPTGLDITNPDPVGHVMRYHQQLVLLVSRRKIAQLTRSREPETKEDERKG